MKIFQCLALILAIALVAGCRRWNVQSTEGPLNGPSSQSPTFVRKKLLPYGWGSERAWAKHNGRKINVYDVAKRIDAICELLPEYEAWVPLQAFIDGKQLRFAPAKFWIVSIDPTVVIMTPFEVPNPDSHSFIELSGAKNERALVSSTLANKYNYGSRIETSTSIQWFVVRSGTAISQVNFPGNVLRLTNQNMVFVLTKARDGMADVARVQ